MKFEINAKKLRSYVAGATSVVPPLSPIVGLVGVVILVEKDSVTFTGSDANIFVRTTVKATDENKLKITETGEFIFEARYLNNILKRAQGEMISFESDKDSKCVLIHCGKTHFKLNTFSDYIAYDLRDVQTGTLLEIDVNDLRENLEKAVLAVDDKNKARPILNGMHVKLNEDRNALICEATNGYWLTKTTAPITLIQEGNITDVVMGRKPTNNLRSHLPESGKVRCGFNSNKIQFKFGENDYETLFQTNLIAGTYPGIGKIIPESTANNLEIASDVFESYIDRVAVVRSEGDQFTMEITFSKDEIKMTGENATTGISQQNIPADLFKYSGEEFSVFVRYEYLKAAVHGMESENIIIGFDGIYKPLKIQGKDSDKAVSIIVPSRRYN